MDLYKKHVKGLCALQSMNDSAVQFYREDYSDKGPIFSVNVK